MYNPKLETFIRIGTSPMTPAQILVELWPKIHKYSPDIKFQLVLFENIPENLMLMHRGWSHYVDELRDDIREKHNEINIVDFDFYNVDILNRCENSNDLLMATKVLKNRE